MLTKVSLQIKSLSSIIFISPCKNKHTDDNNATNAHLTKKYCLQYTDVGTALGVYNKDNNL